jgi:TatD DNase family protein
MTAYVDTHCHLDRYSRPVDVLSAAARADVGVVAVTELPSAYQALTVKLGARRGVLPALGLHPLRAAKASSLELSLFHRLLARVEFVGEVGLDFSRDGITSRSRQLRVFETLLAEAGIQSKILTVHSRRAEIETIDRLIQARASAVLHWYSGPVRHVDAALAAGMCFSVNTAMLRSPSGARMLKAVPRDRILVETDGPYVKTGREPVQPKDVPFVVAALANRWSMTPTEAAQTIRDNLAALRLRASPQ